MSVRTKNSHPLQNTTVKGTLILLINQMYIFSFLEVLRAKEKKKNFNFTSTLNIIRHFNNSKYCFVVKGAIHFLNLFCFSCRVTGGWHLSQHALGKRVYPYRLPCYHGANTCSHYHSHLQAI